MANKANVYAFIDTKPTSIGGVSQVELDAELLKGIKSLKSEKTYTADEIDAELKKEFGI